MTTTTRRIPKFHERLRNALSAILPPEFELYVDGPGYTLDPHVIVYLPPYGRSGIVRTDAHERDWLDPEITLGRILAATERDAIDPRFTDKARADSAAIAAALRKLQERH